MENNTNMLLKNLSKAIMAATTGNGNVDHQFHTTAGQYGKVTNMVVTTTGCGNILDMSYYNETSSSVDQLNHRGLILGKGNTPPTADDYKMENPVSITSDGDLTVSNYNIGYSNDNKTSMTYTMVGVADSTEINEYGIYLGGRYSNYAQVLITRSVLPEPLVIKKGEIKSVTVTIDWDKLSDALVSA